MVALILVGVGESERCECALDLGVGTQIAGDRGGVAAARVRAGKNSSARPGELRQPIGDRLALRDDLAVPEFQPRRR
jgi:hypothetical protein